MKTKQIFWHGLLSIPTVVLAGQFLSTVAVCSQQDRHQEPQSLDNEARVACERWLGQAASEPDGYVVSKFADYDLVLLGETHEVKENCEFVASLVDQLYDAGVRTLCSEFVCSRYNDQLAKIVEAEEYDEPGVALRIILLSPKAISCSPTRRGFSVDLSRHSSKSEDGRRDVNQQIWNARKSL